MMEPAVAVGVFGNACIMAMIVTGAVMFITMNARYKDDNRE